MKWWPPDLLQVIKTVLIDEFFALSRSIQFALLFGFIAALWIVPWRRGDLRKLKGSNVLITGASQGLGEDLAYEYSKAGANVIVTARSEDKLKQIIAKCKDLGAASAQYLLADMESTSDIEALINLVNVRFDSRLDFLVLNHVYNQQAFAWEGDLGYLEKVFRVNMFAYVQLATGFLPSLQSAEHVGSLVVISSVLGKFPSPYFAPYSATKFALQGFFGGWRQELARKQSKVTVTLCVLGKIDTPGQRNATGMIGSARKWLVPAADPDATAKAVIRAGYNRQKELFYPYWVTRPYSLVASLPFGQEVLEFAYKILFD